MVQQYRSEYLLGRNAVPIDYLGVRPRADTQRVGVGPPSRGAGLNDLARLEAGELSSLEVGSYRVDSRLGKGASASVYRGVHTTLGRSVAVKILTKQLGDEPESLQRFIDEARLTARFLHPNVVKVFDFGTTPAGLAYIVMELLDGEDLRTTLDREGALHWPRVRSMLIQLCRGLEAVHDLDVVHRDVKPANCQVVTEGGSERVVVTDFGVACLAGADGDQMIAGTPEYMSPEQARGDCVDARSDVYSVGILLGELLTGRVPHVGNDCATVLYSQNHDPLPQLRDLARVRFVQAALETVYARALATNRVERYASVAEFVEALPAADMPWTRPQSRRTGTLTGGPFVSFEQIDRMCR